MTPTTDWSDNEWNTVREWVTGVLKSTPEVTVTFTKKDGTERVMKCTLDPNVLPKQEIKEGEDRTERLKTDTVVPVYDVEAKGWRSFTVRAVKRVEFTLT